MDKLKELIRRKEQYIATKEKNLNIRVMEVQSQLYDLLFAEMISKLDVHDGVILNNSRNISLVNQLEQVFTQFVNLSHYDVVQSLADDLIKLAPLSAKYFTEGLGVARRQIEKISRTTGYIEKALGVDRNGKIIIGSFLDALSQAPEVRREITEYILQSVTTKTPLKTFTQGFRELIIGNTQVEGRLQKYYRQHVFDTYSQVDAIYNQHFADNLGLKYFLYQGSIIKSSRPFCRKRAGKVFHIDDTKNWKDDPDLIDKATKHSYNPLIERGRYNCRHVIAYLSDDVAQKLME